MLFSLSGEVYMKAVTDAIINHRKLVIWIFCILTVLGAVLQAGVSVNYSMSDYLPENAQSTKALKLLTEEFGDAVPNARVMLRDVSVMEALDYKKKLAAIDGVSGVLWLDDVVDLKQPLETADAKTVETYYKDGNALISLTVAKGREVAVTDSIYALLGDRHALSGNAVDMADAMKLAGSETRTAMIILIPVIILILLLTTSSWLEPVFYLAAIGLSVVMNMGSNIALGEISFISKSISPILQLAVSLDYAIFLLHSFQEFRKQTDDPKEAMRLAMKQAFSSVAASAATTFFGFLALIFMKFQIGSDLGFVLVKGIVFSFLSVMIFLPALTLSCYKFIDRTKHRRLLPSLGNAGKVITKLKIPMLILVALLIVPSYLAQRDNAFSYGTSLLSNGRVGTDTRAINEAFGRQTAIVLLVPRGDPAKEALLGSALTPLPHVTGVISYATTVGAQIPDAFLDEAITSRFYSAHYARIIVYTDTAEEGETAFAVAEEVMNLARSYYGDAVYATGQSVTMYDMKNVVTNDNTVVNIIAIATILLVLLVTFKSASLPLLLIITIETAIWINLSVPYFAGSQLVYIGYLVINTVQLGATVDYAILLTNHYVENRRLMTKKAALLKTLGSVITPILTSGSILALAGFALKMTSTNQIVADMGLLLGRGTLLSMLMALCFLPAALSLFDRLIQKTTYHTRFVRSDDHEKSI
jgi:predicted RND superfamily exporter protein